MKRSIKGIFGLCACVIVIIFLIPMGVSAAGKLDITNKESQELSDLDSVNQVANRDGTLQAASGDEYYYEYYETDGGVRIDRYSGKGGDIVIPSIIDGKNVVEIGSDIFLGFDSITSVVIPESVIDISSSAFENCINLKSVTILGAANIGSRAFGFCSNLENVSMDNVKSIGESAFYECKSLTIVKLPKPLMSISKCVFDGCSSLTSITIPESVTKVELQAFNRCPISSIFIPQNITYFDPYVFGGDSSIVSIDVDPNNKIYSSIDGVLYNKEGTCILLWPAGVTDVDIPDGVESIGAYAFFCQRLTSLNLPESVTSIGNMAFNSCLELTNINIQGPTSIGSSAFNQCVNLTSVNMPNATEIGEYAFGSDYGLTSVDMQNVTKIGEGAFIRDTSLSSILIPESVVYIGDFAFSYCKNLQTVTIESDKTVIYDSYQTFGKNCGDKYPEAKIIGHDPSTAKDYALKYKNTFETIKESTILKNITITTPPEKLSYTVGEPLDINGLVVTGNYSDGSTKIETVKEENISGFDSSKVADSKLLRISIKGKSTTFNVKIKESEIGFNSLYRTHVQNVGWQSWKSNGGMSGTSGQGLRLEGIEIKIDGKEDLSLEYSTHVENIGWQDFVKEGAMSGTEGRSLRLEAIKINLTGTDADKFDIYYQVHAQNYGWLDWAKNGDSAGTAGFGYRLEAIRISVVPKGEPAPGATARPFVQK